MMYSDFKRYNKNNKPYLIFNSIAEFARITEEHIGKSNWGLWESASETRRTGNWHGTDSLQEAINLLKYGWREGIDKLNKEISLSINDGISFKSEYNVVGGQASVPRYLQGIPTNMILQKRVEKPAKILNIYKDISYSCKVTVNEIKEESKKAIQIIQKLEGQGYRINLYVYYGGYVNQQEAFICAKIKDSGEKINIGKMAFPLMHPSMLRRLMLKAIENIDWITPRGWKTGYGTPFYSDVYAKRHEKYLGKNDIHIPSMIRNIDDFINKLNLIK